MALKDRLGEQANGDRDRDGDAALVARYRKQLLAEINLADMALLDSTQKRARLEKVLQVILRRNGPMLGQAELASLQRRVVDEALGLGVLEPLLADASITEIMVNGPDHVFVERRGILHRVDVSFASEEQLYQTIERIVSQVNRRIDESSPMVDARLPGGERVNVIVPPLALDGPTLTIRKFPEPFAMDKLVAEGSIDEPTSQLLASFVRGRLNVVVSGGTGSGKTTLLNSLSAFIPPAERIVTIEDAAELRLLQDNVVRLESRPANVEGRGQITIRDLVRNALRMRPDRIVVGEVRGGETLDMLQAMNTGHEGSLTTVHANSADDAVVRLETLASMSEVNIPYESLRDQVNNAIDVIVHLARDGGHRYVAEVAAVTSRRREQFQLTTIVEAVQEPATRGVSTWLHSALSAALAERLERRGELVPEAFTPGRAERSAPVSRQAT